MNRISKRIFSEYIRDVRLEKNLSLFRVNKLSGFSMDYLNKIEKDFKDPPGMEKLKTLSEIYGVSLLKILKETKPI